MSKEGDARTAIAWTCHPARHRPLAATTVGLFLLAVWVGVQLGWGEWLLTVLAVVILGGSLLSFFLPTRYQMNEDRISIQTLTRTLEKPWSRYRRAAADRHGALLSPFTSRSRLDRFHGLNLRFDAPDRDRVLAFIRSKVPLEIQNGE